MTDNLDAIFWVFGVSTIAFIITSLSASNVISSCIYVENDYQATECSKLLANDRQQQINDEDDTEKGDSAGLAISRVSSLEHTMLSGSELLDATVATSDDSLSATATPAISSILHKSTTTSSHSHAKFITSPRVLCFLITTLLFGVVLSMIVNFLFLFLSDDLHTPASWIGWTGPLQALTELLCFCFSKQMMERFGTAWLIVFAHVCTSLRCLSYTLLPPDALSTNICVLLLQTLHGIGFGIFWGTAVSEMDAMFPPNQRAVAQGVLGALHTGLGTGLGALIGGQLYEYFGASGLFHSAAALSFISALIFCIGRSLDSS
ncbi:MFS general substrate transporter [Lichtheimia hyalospora FSU 10163]|nr:MFS general substrate transporter [Lichtheimia hyalospora FSU 10163]